MTRHLIIALLISLSIGWQSHTSTATTPADFVCRKRDFSTTPGLSQSHISNVQQDERGFLWFATWNGLIRYDGYNFFSFKPILNSDGTIDSNRIYNLKMNADGKIWCVSSDNRLFIFDPASGIFTDLSTIIPEMQEKKVKVLTPLKNGVTWVTFKDYSCIRLVDADPLTEPHFYEAGHPMLHDSGKINSITLDDNGEEWILTDKAAINFTRDKIFQGNCRSVYSTPTHHLLIAPDGNFTRTPRNSSAERRDALSPTTLTVTYTLREGDRIIIGTDHGVWSINLPTGETIRYSEHPVIYLARDSRHRIWGFGRDCDIVMISDVSRPESIILQAPRASQGEIIKNPQLFMEDKAHNIILKPANGFLSYFDEKSGSIKACTFHDRESFSNYHVSDIKKYLVDCDKNLWIFHSGGTDCLSFHPNHFSHTPNGPRQETRAILHDSQGRLWLADRSNSIAISGADGALIGYLTPSGTISPTPAQFSSMPVYGMHQSPSGDIWIATKGDGIYQLSQGKSDNFTIRHYRSNPRQSGSLPSDSIYDIAFTGNTIWLASYGNGLSEARKAPDGSMTFRKVANQPAGLKIRNITVTDGGILLLGTADGLVTADISNQASPRFHINKFRKDHWGLKGNDIMAIVKSEGKYYACVYGSGVSRIDSENLLSDTIHFTNFIIPATETADQIKTAITHGDRIWLISEKALTRFTPSTGLYNTYGASSFIGDFSFSEAEPVSVGDEIVAGTSDGILTFQPAEIAGIDHTRHIAVTGIRYQNDISVSPLNDPDLLTLAPHQRNFSLYLSALEYDSEANSAFRYRLDGYDNGWNYTADLQPAATYNNLPPGHYDLIIEAIDHDGEWDTLSRIIHIEVEPRFVETIWFKLILLIIFVAIMAGMIYAIIYLKRMRNLIQKKYSFLLRVDQLNRDFNMASPLTRSPDATAETAPPDKDSAFIEQSIEFLNANLDNPSLVVEDFARHLGMSRTAYYTKMKQITGLSPVDFIKQMRIKKALKLLDEGAMPITEIAYRVGFADPKYFSRCFKAEMEMTPTQYIERRESEK